MSDFDDLTAADKTLRRARELNDALAPMRRILTDAEEASRAAAAAANAAGMTERRIAAALGVSQPTVHAWLDGRTASPTPGPDAADLAWTLHHLATATASQAARLTGAYLPDTAPSPSAMAPRSAVRQAYKLLTEAAGLLANAAAGLDYKNTTNSRYVAVEATP